MNASRSPRQQHAQAVLDSLHPAHFAGVPSALLEQARRSRLGRRHLLRTALADAAPVLAPDQERWQSWEDSQPWLRWTQAQLRAFTFELGAMALAPAMRVLIQRSEVLFLRDALGADTWHRVQHTVVWARAPEAVQHMGSALLRRCRHDAAAVRDAVFERGKIEFLGHVERSGAMLAERLRLAYAQAPTSCLKECWLPTGVLSALLAEQAEQIDRQAAEAQADGSGETAAEVTE